jgi:hypothetical protein
MGLKSFGTIPPALPLSRWRSTLGRGAAPHAVRIKGAPPRASRSVATDAPCQWRSIHLGWWGTFTRCTWRGSSATAAGWRGSCTPGRGEVHPPSPSWEVTHCHTAPELYAGSQGSHTLHPLRGRSSAALLHRSFTPLREFDAPSPAARSISGHGCVVLWELHTVRRGSFARVVPES